MEKWYPFLQLQILLWIEFLWKIWVLYWFSCTASIFFKLMFSVIFKIILLYDNRIMRIKKNRNIIYSQSMKLNILMSYSLNINFQWYKQKLYRLLFYISVFLKENKEKWVGMSHRTNVNLVYIPILSNVILYCTLF